MRLTRLTSIAVITLVIVIIAAIMIVGFLYRPVWPGSKPVQGAVPKVSAPKQLTDQQRQEQVACYQNQVQINGAVLAYRASTGKYPPTGVIDASSPLVKEHFLTQPPREPVTGQYYQLNPPNSKGDYLTSCPANNPDHKLPQ
jgi:hypothetical protein